MMNGWEEPGNETDFHTTFYVFMHTPYLVDW